MNRREFLSALIASGALYGASGLPRVGRDARASGFAPVLNRFLVNVSLKGGPDFRHLFAPAYTPATASYGYRSWQAMAGAHGLGNSNSAWEARWNNDYLHTADGATEFGILSNCDWLAQQWEAGNVAMVCNAFGSRKRNHALALNVMDLGDLTITANEWGGSGWGGRLAAAADGNVAALTRVPRRFCLSPDAQNPEIGSRTRMINAVNTREIALYRPDPDTSTAAGQSITRSVSSYYAAIRQEMSDASPYRRFVDMEQRLRDFGDPIAARLDSVPLPASIEALFGDDSTLTSRYFGQQIRSLYDSIACSDILALRAASLEYTGLDTHDNQVAELEPALGDLFGSAGALASLVGELPADARANMVIAMTGEFGRQIRANGSGGTDHGEGTTVLLIGEAVNGGVYGDMFPQEELARLADPSPQILGQTSIEHIFGAACDWVQPGSGDVVFPNRPTAPLEADVGLDTLFA